MIAVLWDGHGAAEAVWSVVKEEEGFLGSVEVGVARAIKEAGCGGCEKGLGLSG